MSSGINVDDACKIAFEELKTGHKFRTVLFKVNDKETAIEVVDRIEKQEYGELVELLTKEYADKPIYVVHDYHCDSDDGRKLEKVFFINWCPDTSKIKKKMVQSSSKDALKKVFTGVIEHQATDQDELCEKEIKIKANKH